MGFAIKADIPITGFCYNFATNLLQGLKQLKAEGKLFREDKPQRLTLVAMGAFNHLFHQVTQETGTLSESSNVEIGQVEELIEAAEAFLKIAQPQEGNNA